MPSMAQQHSNSQQQQQQQQQQSPDLAAERQPEAFSSVFFHLATCMKQKHSLKHRHIAELQGCASSRVLAFALTSFKRATGTTTY